MVDEEPKKRKIVVDLDANPEFAQVIEALTKSSQRPKVLKKPFSRMNAISGERTNPRSALRRGLQPQK